MPSIRRLKYFVKAAETGCLCIAADQSHKTRSTIQSAIRFIEAVTGVALFQRHDTGVDLTPEGKQVLEHAKEVLRHHEAIRRIGK
jgi:DNA-binding transcriptional LysR family regulator